MGVSLLTSSEQSRPLLLIPCCLAFPILFVLWAGHDTSHLRAFLFPPSFEEELFSSFQLKWHSFEIPLWLFQTTSVHLAMVICLTVLFHFLHSTSSIFAATTTILLANVYYMVGFFWGSPGDTVWKSFSRVWLFGTPWTLQSMEFSRPEYWKGLPFPSPGDPCIPGIEPGSPALQVDSLPAEPPGKPQGGTSGKETARQCRRHRRCGFDPWVRKIPCRRAWPPIPVFLPGESHGQKSLLGYGP